MITARDHASGLQVDGDRFPFQSPEQIQPVDQNYRLAEADLRPREWQANTVSRRDRVAIQDGYLETARMTARNKGL